MEGSEKDDDGTSVDHPQTSTPGDDTKNKKDATIPLTQPHPYMDAENKLDARSKSLEVDDDVELSESSSQVTVVEASELHSTTDGDVKSEGLDEKTLNDIADDLEEAEDATVVSGSSSDEDGDEFDDDDIDEILGGTDDKEKQEDDEEDEMEEPVQYEAVVYMDDVRQSEIKTMAGFEEWQEPEKDQTTSEESSAAKPRVHFNEPEVVEDSVMTNEEKEQDHLENDKLNENNINHDDIDDNDDVDDDDDEFDDDEFDDDDFDDDEYEEGEFESDEVYYDDRKFVIIEETRNEKTITYEAKLVSEETTTMEMRQNEHAIDNTSDDVQRNDISDRPRQIEQFQNIRQQFEKQNHTKDNDEEIKNENKETIRKRKEIESRFKERDEMIAMLDNVVRPASEDYSNAMLTRNQDNETHYANDQRVFEERGVYRYQEEDEDDYREQYVQEEDDVGDLDVSQGFIVLWHRSDGEEEPDDQEKPWLNSKAPSSRQARPNPTMNSSKHVENLLYCSMCRNRMKNPKSLPCLHAFCRECLQQHVKKSDGRLICPQCRKDCPLSTDGVDGLLDSHFIHNLSEFVEQGGTAKDDVPNCDGCDKDASDRCLDCPCPLCPECSKMHKRMRGTKTHRIISLKEYNSLSDREKIMMQPTSCPYHPRCELEFFCTVCEVPICMKCAVCGHEDHKRMNLVDVYEKQAMEIDSLRNKLAERLKSFEEVAGRTRSVAETLEKEEKGVENQIVEHAERMHEAIDKRKEELIRELKMKSKSKKDILRRQVNNFGEVMHSLHDTYEKTGHLLTYGNRSDVVFAKKSALQRIIEQLDVPLKSQPEENSFIGFKSIINENVKLKLGNVLTTPAVAFQSRLERASGSYPLIGTEQVFVVRSVGHDGIEVKQGGAPVVAELTRPGSKGVALVDSVDAGDGNYRIAFNPDTPGRYRLDAKLFDESTRDSPMEFEVRSRWEVTVNYSQDMKQPHDVTKAWDDTYAIADYGNNRILIRDIAGKFYDQITFAGLEKPFCPISLATTPNNEIVCSDYNNHQIFVTRMDRSLKLRFGSSDLSRPLGVASFQSGKYAVGDGQTIKLFGNGGELLKTVGRRGQGDGEFSNPWFIATSSRNFMAVADEGNGRIQLLDAEGRFLKAFKVMPSGGQALNPRGVYMDDSDNIFVSATTSVLMYSSDGRFICRVNGEDSKMKSPCGLTMLKAGLGTSPVLLVADRSDQCVKGFRL
ncbi:uncharacterized protein [Antedon mediterranea]|uniref:uncharacterized protein n=1 Tax=Antedon mediterranea TaxID=105859 RepID=UPI003AF56925